jgi:ubiquinone/menaquinone biosynthesis C-methylase UbiE
LAKNFSKHRCAEGFFSLGLLALAAAPIQAQPTQNATRYESMRLTQDGIGKRYLGREIAGVMGWQGASWLERQERDKEERTDLLLRDLNLMPGLVIADIGAGTGYLSRQMARQVGPKGMVYAVDVQPEMIQIMRGLAKSAQVNNIKPVLSTTTKTNLPDGSIDLAIMVDVYHELEFPYEMLSSMIASLKPGGQLVFVEYRSEDASVPIKEVHKMSEAQVRKEVAVFPELTWERTSKRLPWQHVVVFRKQP